MAFTYDLVQVICLQQGCSNLEQHSIAKHPTPQVQGESRKHSVLPWNFLLTG